MNYASPTDQESNLSQLSNFLTYRISRLHAKLNAQASRILGDTVGLTLTQWRLVAFIGGAKTVTASELIRYTAMDKGLVSRNVKALIELGLVASISHERDSRVHLLSLTDSGTQAFETALPIMQARQANLQKSLSAADIATFRRVMTVLEAAAEETGL